MGNILKKIVIVLIILCVLFAAGVFVFHTIWKSDELEMLEEAGYVNLVQVGDYSLNVPAFGNKDGEHTVVCLSGVFQADFSVAFRKATAELEKDNLVVFPDRAGYGLSDDSGEDMTLEYIVEDYRKALKAAGYKSPYVLLGYSAGGAYASYWSVKYPDEVESIILIDSAELSENKYFVSENDTPGFIGALINKIGFARFSYKDKFRRYPDIYSEEEQKLADALNIRTMEAFAPSSEAELQSANVSAALAAIAQTDIPKLYVCSSSGFDSKKSVEDFNKWSNRQIVINGLSDERMLEVYDENDENLLDMLEEYQQIRDNKVNPFTAALGNCSLVLLGGEHGIFLQKPEELGAVVSQFVKGISGSDLKTATLDSFSKEAPAGLYSLDYMAGFSFDEYLKTGFEGSAAKSQFISRNVLNSIDGIVLDYTHNCSVFVCKNEKNEVLFCRNLDTSNVAPCCILKTEGVDGYKNISATDLSIGCDAETKSLDLMGDRKLLLLALPYYTNDGMNEYGLAIAKLSTGRAKTAAGTGKIALDPSDVVRLVLEKAKSVDEALELLDNYKVDFGNAMTNDPYHYIIADSTGKSVVVEFGEGNLTTTDSTIVTNFNLHGVTDGLGKDRFDTMKKTLSASKSVLSNKKALQLLEELCMKNMERYSVIYNLSTGDVTVFCNGDSSLTADFHLDLSE